MDYTKSYKGVLKKYNNEISEEVRKYFEYLPNLINTEKQLYEVTLAYLFLKIEQAQNRCLYGGIVKIHRGDYEFASRIINKQHLTREGFKVLYKNIFGRPFSDLALSKLGDAEKIRDKVIHGKNVPDDKLREAIIACLEYAELVNEEISAIDEAKFKPFGDMRGFKGRANSFDVRTTKWLMKGIGFAIRS